MRTQTKTKLTPIQQETAGGIGSLVPQQEASRELQEDALVKFGALAVRLLSGTKTVMFAPGLTGLVGVEIPELHLDNYSEGQAAAELTGQWGNSGDTRLWAGHRPNVITGDGPVVTRKARFVGSVLLIDERQAFGACLTVAREIGRDTVLHNTSLDGIADLVRGNALRGTDYDACLSYGAHNAEGMLFRHSASRILFEPQVAAQ